MDAVETTRRKACPFCGEHATGFSRRDGRKVILCGSCGAMGPLHMEQPGQNWNASDRQTLELWNRRQRDMGLSLAIYLSGTISGVGLAAGMLAYRLSNLSVGLQSAGMAMLGIFLLLHFLYKKV